MRRGRNITGRNMDDLRFSIITPINATDEKRVEDFQRCLESVRKQSFSRRKFEHIIVNDGSTVPLNIPDREYIRVLDQINLNRVTAYNNGIANAKGEIICLLDSDDEYDPDYLFEVNKMFIENPEYKMFNFGCKFIHKDGGEAERGPFEPKELEVGHESFGGGHIVNGTFVFYRSVYEDLGAYPKHHIENIDCRELNYGGPRELWMWSPYDFSAAAQMEFPDMRQYFMVNHVNEPYKIVQELGNPWGNDYYLFYKYTRKYHSKPIDKKLYIVHLKI